MVDKNTMRKVAAISRIRLSDEEIDSLRDDFKEAMTIFSKIDEADVDDDADIYEAITLIGPTDDDESSNDGQNNDNDADSIIRLSPYKKGRFIKGPKV